MTFQSVVRRLLAGMLALLAQGASAQIFDDGLPASWQCLGHCGVATADGDVSLAPNGGTHYGWISTDGGADGVLLPGVNGPEDSGGGSLLHSHLFTAAAGQALTFQFNYVTTDAGDFSDYAWVRLMNADHTQAALLVTARSSSGGGAVPGFGMPPPAAMLTPPFVNLTGVPPAWRPLGADSGTCYVEPCGMTDWVGAAYTIAAGGSYYLEFGVMNWFDTAADTGLAFDAIALDGAALPPVPEPAGWAQLAAGCCIFALLRRRLR